MHNGENSNPQPGIKREFISGVERIEHIGGACIEITFYVNQTVDGRTTRVSTNFSIVMPVDALPDGIGKSLMAIGRTVYARADGVLALMH